MRSFSSVVTTVVFPLFLSFIALDTACAADDAVGDSEASACVAYVDLTWRRERRVLCCSGVDGAAAAEDVDVSSPPLSTRTTVTCVSLAAGAGDVVRDVSSRREERRGAAVASPAASSAILQGTMSTGANFANQNTRLTYLLILMLLKFIAVIL